jgi:anti-sigma B factor antagonist
MTIDEMADPTPPDAPAPGRLQISSESGSDSTVLSLTGELDIASAPTLERAIETLDSEGAELVIIDLGGVTFMDSTGLRALLLAHQRTSGNGHELRLRRGPRQVQRVFELSGTLDTFTFEA